MALELSISFLFLYHIHAIASDGLFRKTGIFYVMPDVDLKPLEEIFRLKVFEMLKEEGTIDDDIIKVGQASPLVIIMSGEDA